MAMPSGNEGEDLGAPLSCLLELVSTLSLIVSLFLIHQMPLNSVWEELTSTGNLAIT
jgi:hypothetical protein